jgi:type III restriction enzyme
MAITLFPFQKEAIINLRDELHDAVESYANRRKPQIISYCAPTGAGKTIILSSLFENILFGDERYPECPSSIFVWLSDSPELNEQSRNKIATTTEKIKYNQCVMIEDASFDQEVLDDGYIYFLNTQKLSKSSNLTKHGDGRTYTIWETLANTVAEKYDHLFFVIDEAHRGMHNKDEAKATSIMQKFIIGSPEDNLPQMPIIIGMSATPARFNSLIAGTTSTIHTIVTSTDEVRSSGLLKDRIIITYPETSTKVAVLKAATQNWKMMCDHWYQYCYEQHYAHVNPILLVQVLNGHGDADSDTDLDDCLKIIEDTLGTRFDEHEVVHAFGQTGDLIVNGLKVHYCEPSKISDDRSIKVVFFKESLSTGWDCPRAETMVSFRHAEDSTYIAQLLGRMIRTPMQMHIMVDDLLNEVHLFLPFFDNATVTAIVEALQNSEGGELPVAIEGESIDDKKYEVGTTKPKSRPVSSSTSSSSSTQSTSGTGTQPATGNTS